MSKETFLMKRREGTRKKSIYFCILIVVFIFTSFFLWSLFFPTIVETNLDRKIVSVKPAEWQLHLSSITQKYQNTTYWEQTIHLHQQLLQNEDVDSKCNPENIKNIIVVSGMPRSGTTITGKILSIPIQSLELHEPTNPDNGNIRRCGEDSFQAVLQNYSKISQLFPSQFINISDIKDSSEVFNLKTYFDYFFKCKRFDTIVMKDPIALYSLEWLYTTYNPLNINLNCKYPMKMLIVVRHPAAIISSWMNLNWSNQDVDLLIEVYIRYQTVIQMYWEKYGNDPHWIFSRHEDFCWDSITRSHDWLLLTDSSQETLDFDKKVINYTSEMNEKDHSQYGRVHLNSLSQIDTWKYRLNMREIYYIYEKTYHLWTTFYDESDWFISNNTDA